MNHRSVLSREDMPSPSEIIEWWRSVEGRAHAKTIQRRYGAPVVKRLGKIPKVKSSCWACGCCEGRWGHGLDRCHIVPLALGGGSAPSNLLMMCRSCHQDNPDTRDPAVFWSWFCGVREEWVERLSAVALREGSAVDVDALIHDYHEAIKKDPPLLVNGALAKGFTVGLVRSLRATRGGSSAGVGEALAKAHVAAEGARQDEEAHLNRGGFTPSVRAWLELQVIAWAEGPWALRPNESLKDGLRPLFIREFGRIDGVLMLADSRVDAILDQVFLRLEAKVRSSPTGLSMGEVQEVKRRWVGSK